MGHVVGQILTVNEVRANIKTLREAVLHERAEIHFGERGTDEVVIISSKVLATLKAKARLGSVTTNGGAKARLVPKPVSFVEAILAGGTFEGPPDLAEHIDDYLEHGPRSLGP